MELEWIDIVHKPEAILSALTQRSMTCCKPCGRAREGHGGKERESKEGGGDRRKVDAPPGMIDGGLAGSNL